MLKIQDYDFRLLDLQNAFYQFAFGYFEDFKKVILKYDGNMPSKRIETELKKISPFFSFSRENSLGWYSINFYCPQDKRYFIKEYKNYFGEKSTIAEYIKDDSFPFVQYEKIVFPINAKDLIEKVQKKIDYRLEAIKKQESAKKELQSLIDSFNKAGQEFAKAKEHLACLRYVCDCDKVLF